MAVTIQSIKDKLAIVKMEIVERENDLLLLEREEKRLIKILKKCGEV